MKKLFITAIFFLFGFWVFGQSTRFEILDQSTGKPAQGVQLKLFLSEGNSFQGFTDGDGIWEFYGNLKSSFQVQFRSVFYQNLDTQLNPSLVFKISLKPSVYIKDEIVVSGLRNQESPNVQVISQNEIKKNNSGRDLPFILQQVPGSVVQSDAGNGIGYTGIRIRGVDPSRINTTVNGIPLNDAESQTVFWVNMPDFVSSSSRIEISRGVGTSTNGTANFGAGINLETGLPSSQSFGNITLGGGYIPQMPSKYIPFNDPRLSGRVSAQFGTGIQNGWYAIGRLSKINSNGFVDRSQSDLSSYFIETGKIASKWVIRLVHFSGKEQTGQAWNGIPSEIIFDPTKPNRIYNEFTYDGQVDHYGQNHFQFFATFKPSVKWQFNLAAHYTKGKGYYEEYKTNRNLQYYGIQSNAFDSSGLPILSSDLIRRRWLNNDFFGNTWSIIRHFEKAELMYGGSWNIYDGRHFGEVIWARYAGNSEIRKPYYTGHSIKSEINNYVKWNKMINNKIKIWADAQFRYIHYALKGEDDNSGSMNHYDTTLMYAFFNPKAGLQYQLSSKNVFTLTMGSVGREPLRSDIIQAARRQFPKQERLYNVELGWNRKMKISSVWANSFIMYYTNQLIPDGSINDVGAYNRINIPESYRLGIEAGGKWNISSKWSITGNVCLSKNKVVSFNQYIDIYDSNYNWLGNSLFGTYSKADLAFSPNLVAASTLVFRPLKGFEIGLQTKYVSKQYLDNTQSADRKLNSFIVNDLRFTYSWKQITANAWIYNLLNEMYEPNGYSFMGLVDGKRQDYNYFYPMSGRNLMVSITAAF